MIQFNLLPDVKLQYIKAERQKNLVISVATIVTIASIAVLVLLLFSVFVVQRKNINDLGKDIDTAATELRSIEDLDKILTVQSQLGSLTGLHDDKVVSSRLYNYLTEITPNDASISNLTLSFEEGILEVGGRVNTLSLVNKYADSFKFTVYKVNDDEKGVAAFTNVVLSSFSRESEGAEYTLTMNFDPRIFSNEGPVTLEVPNITTTRPDAERPAALFQAPGTGEGGTQ